jgi:hypothetical protein
VTFFDLASAYFNLLYLLKIFIKKKKSPSSSLNSVYLAFYPFYFSDLSIKKRPE